MGDLEEIDARQVRRDELRIDLLLDIAHEQEPARTDLPGQHDGHVVDPGAAVGRVDGHATSHRPQDLEVDLVHGQPVAGGHPGPDRRVATGHLAKPRGVAWSRPTHARLENAGDPVALEQERQPGHVILVGVRQDDRVDPPVPGRDPRVERHEEAVGIGPTIDQ